MRDFPTQASTAKMSWMTDRIFHEWCVLHYTVSAYGLYNHPIKEAINISLASNSRQRNRIRHLRNHLKLTMGSIPPVCGHGLPMVVVALYLKMAFGDLIMDVKRSLASTAIFSKAANDWSVASYRLHNMKLCSPPSHLVCLLILTEFQRIYIDTCWSKIINSNFGSNQITLYIYGFTLKNYWQIHHIC